MKRRRFFQALATAPAAPAVLAQAPAGSSPAAAPPETVGLEMTVPDQAGATVPRFFDSQQFAALRRLSDLLMPPINETPGAMDAGAAEFLDFLIGQSPSERQQLYRTGLDALNTQARKRYGKLFSDIDSAQADALLAPLRQPWTPEPPADLLARFLLQAKQDVRIATTNSQEYGTAGAAGRSRRRGSGGLYWYPLD